MLNRLSLISNILPYHIGTLHSLSFKALDINKTILDEKDVKQLLTELIINNISDLIIRNIIQSKIFTPG
jgi:hypothetical protein